MDTITVGFALTGSYCTFNKTIPQIKTICDAGYNVIPIMSENVSKTDTRFGNSNEFKQKIEEITKNKLISKIKDAEPIGPKKLLDALIVAPCTGNTLAKISNGITDTTVTMAVKSSIRNDKPIILAISTNDGLGNSAKNIGNLMNIRNVFFVPFGQDDYINKPRSLVADMKLIKNTLEEAFKNKQIQPMLINKYL